MSDNWTVFIVNDDPGALESLRWMVEQAAFRVKAFPSSRAFLDAYRPEVAGCLVLDVRMPEMDGLELQQTLRDRKICLPIIFMTANGDVLTYVRAFRGGAMAFMEKPINGEELLDHIERLIVQDKEQAPAAVPLHVPSTVPLHRLGEARQREQISRCNVARHLGIAVQDVRRQKRSTTDLPLSVLYKWAEVLELPVAELVEEPSDSLSSRLVHRARLVRVMKTAMSLLEQSGDPQTRQFAQTMVNQLIEVMPELRGYAEHAVGKRRSLDELGIAAERSLPDDIFTDRTD